jgi:hypothetical protein
VSAPGMLRGFADIPNFRPTGARCSCRTSDHVRYCSAAEILAAYMNTQAASPQPEATRGTLEILDLRSRKVMTKTEIAPTPGNFETLPRTMSGRAHSLPDGQTR